MHLAGGGGEAGPASSVPPLPVEALTRHGITTAIGLLGTDDLVRTPAPLLQRVAALRHEGLGAWMLSGGYDLPAATVMGDVAHDLLHLDPVLGVGEVALGDHRGARRTRADRGAAGQQARIHPPPPR